MALYKILLPTGEDGAVVDKKVLRDPRIRYDDKQLVPHEHRKERAVLLGPFVENTFGIFAEECITKERTGRDGMPFGIGNVSADNEWNEKVESSDQHCDDGKVS